MVLSAIGISIKEFLRKTFEITDSGTSITTSVELKSPADVTNEQNLVTIFLYEISQNPYFKNHENVLNPNTGSVKNKPMAVDLSYLITPFATPSREYDILTTILRAFYDKPVLSGTDLKESLHQNGNDSLRIVFHPLTSEKINHLWGLFPEKPYRPSLSYTVSPVFIPSQRQLESTLVRDAYTGYGSIGAQ